MAVNDEIALPALDRFIELTTRHGAVPPRRGSYTPPPQKVALDVEIRKQLALIERIAAEVEPDRQHDFKENSSSWSAARNVAIRIRGLLAGKAESEAIFSPVGPKMSARDLHPRVWDAAARLWDDTHRRAAVQGAATAVEVWLQAKMSRPDIGGVDLVREAFRPAPPEPGRPRLRFPEFEPGSQMWTNAHEGAMNFGVGCVQRIRNLASHATEELDEQDALEQLAALSLFARWIDAGVLTETEAPATPPSA